MTENPFRAYRFDEFELDLHRRYLLRNGVVIDLTPTEFAVLKLLCEKNRKLVTAGDLKTNVWRRQIISDTSPREYVYQIRTKLQDRKHIIKTSRGNNGWILECDVEEIDDSAHPQPIPEPLPEPVPAVIEPENPATEEPPITATSEIESPDHPDVLRESNDSPELEEPMQPTAVINESEESNEPTAVVSESEGSNEPRAVINEPEESNESAAVINESEESNDPTVVINEPEESNKATAVINGSGESNEPIEVISESEEFKEPTDDLKSVPLVIGSGGGQSSTSDISGVTSSVSQSSNSGFTGNDFLFITAAASLTIFFVPAFYLIANGKWDEHATHFLSFAQAIAVFGGIGYDYFQRRLSNKTEPGDSKPHIAVAQFRTFWTCLLVSWFFLYVAWGFQESTPLTVITTLLNNTNSLTLWLCYVVLDRPTVKSLTDQNLEHTPWKLGVLIVVAFSLIEAILLLGLHLANRDAATKYVIIPSDLLSGFVGAVAMALCISRLHSRLLGPNQWLPWIPVILYLYVVIQPFYGLVNEAFSHVKRLESLKPELDLLRPAIMQLAFQLKALMFVYVMLLIRSRRLMFYMINARQIYENVEKQWGEFR